jgi:outer membrane protein assembly factor BamB
MPWRRAFLTLLLLTALTRAADWPQWLGPHRDGSTSETVAAWKDAPKVLWKQPVGEGHSSPVVAGNRVFVHAKVKDKDEEEVLAFDAPSGKPLWKTSYPRGNFKALFGNGPRGTPAVEGDRVYTFGITGILSCFDVKEGQQLWQVDTLKKFDAKNLFFGMSGSPLIDGDRVLVEVGGKGSGVVALNKTNGEVVWKALDDPASYASPILVEAGGRKQAVFLTGDGLVGLDSTKGDLLGRQPWRDLLLESSTTPVKIGDLVVASSITLGAVAVRLDGEKIADKPVWKNSELNCYFSTPVAVGKDHLYMVTGTKPPALPENTKADLRCVEAATGKELWKKEKVGKYHAALLRTGNDKLLMLDDSGELVLLEPSAKEYKELARAKVCGPETWAHPALAGGRLYVRDRDNLICLQLPQ